MNRPLLRWAVASKLRTGPPARRARTRECTVCASSHAGCGHDETRIPTATGASVATSPNDDAITRITTAPRSANEEMQSTNEELQSTNEELRTVNHELQAKMDELSRTNDDMKNLLDSTEIATLFLDGALRVRRFTPLTTRIIKLIPGDVGRPIADFATALADPDLVADAQEVLRTLLAKEKAVAARDGRWFNVRIMPYRTQDARIDGVVITFIDITVAKTLEAELRARESKTS